MSLHSWESWVSVSSSLVMRGAFFSAFGDASSPMKHRGNTCAQMVTRISESVNPKPSETLWALTADWVACPLAVIQGRAYPPCSTLSARVVSNVCVLELTGPNRATSSSGDRGTPGELLKAHSTWMAPPLTALF